MKDPAPAIPLEELVAHREWVRRVARALVRDESLADDLEQEVWLEAIRSPPRSGRSLGAWLSTAMRHNLLDLRRSESRRRVREEAVARPEAGKSAADLVVEAETLKGVVAAVLALEEPYRGSLLFRYFEDLPPREISRRQGVPLETVRTRLRRGLAMLRERLDAGHGGDRKAWCIALEPLLRDPRPSKAGPGGALTGALVAAGMGGLLMIKIALAVAAAVVAVAAVVLLLPAGMDGPAAGPAGGYAIAPPVPGSGAPIPAGRPGDPIPDRVAADLEAPEDPAPPLLLRVRDLVTGRPIPGAAVSSCVGTRREPIAADPEGRVLWPRVGTTDVVLWATAPGFIGTEVRVGAPERERDVPLRRTEFARGIARVRGRVVDSDGIGVAGARVRGFTFRGTGWEDTSDAAGRFELRLCDANGSMAVVAEKDGLRGAAWAARDVMGSRRDVEEVDVRLGEVPAIPVRIEGADAGAFELRAGPVGGREWMGAEGRWEVRDGTAVVLPAGLLRLELTTGSGDPVPAAPGAVVFADAGGVRPADPVLFGSPSGGALRELRFHVATGTRGVLVVDGATGAPVEGAEVMLEDAALADAVGRTYDEVPEEEASRPGGISYRLGEGRRAPVHRRRTATSGADGIAWFRGWVPSPAILSVRGPHVVEAFLAADLAGPDPAPLRVEVTVGGTLRLLMPEDMGACLVEPAGGGEVRMVDRSPAALCLPEGLHRVRFPGATGGVVEKGGFSLDADVKRGRETVVDLTAIRPPRPFALRFGTAPDAPMVCQDVLHGEAPPVRRAGGVFEWPSRWLLRFHRQEIQWMDGPSAHAHEISIEGATSRELLPGEVDASYSGGAVRLLLEPALEAEVVVLTGQGALGSPSTLRHVVRVGPSGPGADGRLIRDLPAGSYGVSIEGDWRSAAEPAIVVVESGATTDARIRFADRSCRVHVLWASGRPMRPVLKLVSRTPGGDPRRWSAVIGEDDRVDLADVPDGEYTMEIRALSSKQEATGLWTFVIVHGEDVTVSPGSRSFTVSVPAR